MRIFKETHVPFVKHNKIALSVSGIAIVLGLLLMIFIRGLNYGIDFTGGSLFQIEFQKSVTTAEVRSALATQRLQNAIIQRSAGRNEYMIRLAENETSADIPARVSAALASLPDNPFSIVKTEKVGPKIGRELRVNMVKAILAALVVIGIYISVRFQLRFAVGAVVALIHDVLITLGLFSLFQLEISLSVVAAFLTIVGYSLNDTIVIFDRVRENLKTKRFDAIDVIINTSINESLSRTIVTSVTTLIVVIALAFARGEVRIFAIAMIIGVLVGTYSSVYIAGPIVIYWQKLVNLKTK